MHKMKISQSLLKLIIRLIILLIFFVLLFIISSFLYSARYWPDVYNYINANITIKRIPTISELELTVLKQDDDFTTEVYTSTERGDYVEASTVDDFDFDEFMKEEFDFKRKVKRNIVIEQIKDYIELPPKGIFVDYIFLEEPVKIDTEEDADDVNILKTSVTGMVDNELTTNTEVNEITAVTQKYYTVQFNKNKRSISEDENELDTDKNEIIKQITTKEGYLVENDSKLVDFGVFNNGITKRTNEIELAGDEDISDLLIKDSVDISKLSTRGIGEVERFTKKPEKMQMADTVCHGDANCQDFAKSVFPWIVTIFIKNDTNNSQFHYQCDGALLSDEVIITDGRCMFNHNNTIETEHVLAFLGKANLQSFGETEKLQKIKEIIIHPNFTRDAEGKTTNDLALLITEESVVSTDNIHSACIHHEEDFEKAATTAWSLDGALQPIFFNKEKSDFCYDKDENVFCATYGNEVALCPSYGGVYATKVVDRWCLQGIFYGDPADRGICFTKDVFYTSLRSHIKWITSIVELSKNYIL